jgi:mannosyltransferase
MTAKTVMHSWQHVCIILAITLLGFGLRLYDLGGDSLWYDEILTARTAKRDLAGIWTFQTEVSDHPPLLYVLTHLALKLGHSDFAVRLPPALLGALAIPLVYRLGRVWWKPWVGLWGALLMALSPFHIRYCQEARHYVPLVTIALASLLFLHQGLKRRSNVWWGAFAAATALGFYTHYASFIILAVEVAFATLALGRAWIRERDRRSRTNVLATAGRLSASTLVATILYIPWTPSVLGHLEQNLGPEAARATAVDVPIGDWVVNAFNAFGADRVTAFIFGGLSLVGWGNSLRRRAWERAWLILVWLAGPFLLTRLMDVSRYPFPKYVAYVLPIYLLSAAAGGHALIGALARVWPSARRWVSGSLAALAALLLIVVSASAIGQVYAYVERDWKGAVQYLSGMASEGDVFITATLDLSSGFNQGRFSLPYYLGKTLNTYCLLPAADIGPELNELGDAAWERRRVWALVIDRGPEPSFDDPNLRAIPFQGDLYLVYMAEPRKTALEESIALFEALTPRARSPQPQRKMLTDLAAMYNAARQFEKANETLDLALNLDVAVDSRLYAVTLDTYHGLLEKYSVENRTDETRAVAWELLALNAKDEAALRVLTVYDFIARLPDAKVNALQEPFQHVDTRVFTMPQNGDWKAVLFMHPTSEASYDVALPDEAVEFRFSVAMAPESWDWGGDGSTFTVRLRNAHGEEHVLFSRHVSNAPEDRQWHGIYVDLAPFAGQDVVITFMTEPGPQGDFTGDWAGWGNPRIVWSHTP